MKRICAALLALLLLFPVACASKGQAETAEAPVAAQASPTPNEDETRYKEAEALLNAYDYEGALAVYRTISGYEDSADKAKRCQYEIADLLLFQREYDEAWALFEELGGYRDSADKAQACLYQKATAEADQLYTDFLKLYNPLKNYKNSIQHLTYLTINCKTYKDFVERITRAKGGVDILTVSRYLGTSDENNQYVEGSIGLSRGEEKAYYLTTFQMTKEQFRAVSTTEQRDKVTNYLINSEQVWYDQAKKGQLWSFLFWSIVYCYENAIDTSKAEFPALQGRIQAFTETYPDYPLNESFLKNCDWLASLLEKVDQYQESVDAYNFQLNDSVKVDPFEKALRASIVGNKYTCTEMTILDGDKANISMSSSEFTKLLDNKERITLVISDDYSTIQFVCIHLYDKNSFVTWDTCKGRIKAEKDGAAYHCLVIWDETPVLLTDCALTATDLTFRVDNGQVSMTLAFDGDSAELRFDPNMHAKYFVELKLERASK